MSEKKKNILIYLKRFDDRLRKFIGRRRKIIDLFIFFILTSTTIILLFLAVYIIATKYL